MGLLDAIDKLIEPITKRIFASEFGKSISPLSGYNVMEKLNNRSRKTMEYQTPNQVFFGLKSNVALTT